jgi:hypothetical protein
MRPTVTHAFRAGQGMGISACMLRQNRDRVLAVGALGLSLAAALVAVASGLGAHPSQIGAAKAAAATLTRHDVQFEQAQVRVEHRPNGLSCATVTDGSSPARSCLGKLGAQGITYAVTANGVGGLAGSDVQAVIVRLTRKGTVWATIRDGAFYAAVPLAYRPRRVIKVLRDGSRHGFSVPFGA